MMWNEAQGAKVTPTLIIYFRNIKTQSPTKSPMNVPTKSPTKAPTKAPTTAPNTKQ
eukprot:CCRYP_004801-RD/>CCRYP_004801-RD protein AED:0.45 eAED:0.45 QI:209/1/1/1/1/1/2/0/55